MPHDTSSADSLHGRESRVHRDPDDERDRLYPPPRATHADAWYRPHELFLDDIFGHDIEIPQAVDPGRYRSLADPTWHQRGEECTGFALAAIAEFHLRKDLSPRQWAELPEADRETRRVSRRMLYEMAQEYDERDFHEGSTLRGALKGWKKLGVSSDEMWPYAAGDERGEKHGRLTLPRVLDAVARPGGFYFRIDRSDVDNMRDALARGCPLYASAVVHVGWHRLYLPLDDPTITWREGDQRKGRHAFVIVGYDDVGFWIHNSFGPMWGDRGYARLPYDQWAMFGEDTWVVVPPPAPRPTPAHDPAPPVPADPHVTNQEMWRHVVCVGDDGRLSAAGGAPPDEPAVGTLLYLFHEQTRGWARRRLAIVADGGYWPRENTIEFLRPLRTLLMENEIYPLFVLWDSPWFASTRTWLLGERGLSGAEWLSRSELDDFWANNGGSTMSRVLAAESVAPRVWAELQRRSRAAALRDDGALRALARRIAYKWRKEPFDVHLVGHGTGDFAARELAGLLPMPIETCQLVAPASQLGDFHRTYGSAVADDHIGHLTVAALTDAAEHDDRVGPIPGSTLLLAADVLAREDADLDRLVDHSDGEEDPVWSARPEPIAGIAGHIRADPAVGRLVDSGHLEIHEFADVTHTRLIADPHVHRLLVESMSRIPSSAWLPVPEDPIRAADGRASVPDSNRRHRPETTADRPAPTNDPLRSALVSDPLRRAEREHRSP